MSEFREMRRKRQQLSDEESVGILQRATSGTLALLGDNGYPYAVPISYVYSEGKLYFHSALTGHKVDAIKNHDKASFGSVRKLGCESRHDFYKSRHDFYKSRQDFRTLQQSEYQTKLYANQSCNRLFRLTLFKS